MHAFNTLFWDDFDGEGAPVDARLVRATVETEEGEELSNDFFGDIVIRQVAPHGYDATENGDDVVVVVHKETWRSRDVFRGLPFDPEAPPSSEPSGDGANRFALQTAAPELAPGLTEPVPAPNPDHRHQLCVLSLD